jgi:hypothetical protein
MHIDITSVGGVARERERERESGSAALCGYLKRYARAMRVVCAMRWRAGRRTAFGRVRGFSGSYVRP